MSLFQQSATQKFTPKSIKLENLYKTTTGGKAMSASTVMSAAKALKQAGFEEKKIRQALYNNQELSVSEMKTVAGALNKAKVFGFTKDPKRVIEQHLNKERVKAQNIARIRSEHILEAGQEELTSYGNTSLNQKAIGPNSGPREQKKQIVVKSLSGKSSGQAISSFGTKQSASSSLSGLGKGTSNLGSKAGGSSVGFRPKF
jgi:hypothetical protein